MVDRFPAISGKERRSALVLPHKGALLCLAKVDNIWKVNACQIRVKTELQTIPKPLRYSPLKTPNPNPHPELIFLRRNFERAFDPRH